MIDPKMVMFYINNKSNMIWLRTSKTCYECISCAYKLLVRSTHRSCF